MRFHKTLYLKELKQHRIAFALYIFLTVVVTVIRQLHGWDTLSPSNGMAVHENLIMLWLEMGLVFVLPVVLVYSWYREEHDGTTYQLLSVPVSPSTILMNRFMAFLTVAVPVHLVRMLITIGTQHPLAEIPDPGLHIGWMVNMTLSAHIVALSIACLVIAFGQKHRYHRLLSGLMAVFVAMIFISFANLAFLVFAVIAAGQLMKYRRFRIAAIIGVVCVTGALYYGAVTENVLVMSLASGLFEPLACFGFTIYSLSRFETHVEV